MEKKRVRVYKAPDGKGKYINKTSKFLEKAQAGGQPNADMNQYFSFAYDQMKNGVPPENVFTKFVNSGLDQKTAYGILNQVMQYMVQKGELDPEYAKADQETELAEQPEGQGEADVQAAMEEQRQADQSERNTEMLSDTSGYENDYYQSGGSAMMGAYADQMKRPAKPLDIDTLIENTPGIQAGIVFPGIEHYIPDYEPVGWDNVSALQPEQKTGGTVPSKKDFVKNVMALAKKQQGGDEKGLFDENQKSFFGKGKRNDTLTNDVEKRKTGFISALKDTATKVATEELYDKMAQSNDPMLQQIAMSGNEEMPTAQKGGVPSWYRGVAGIPSPHQYRQYYRMLQRMIPRGLDISRGNIAAGMFDRMLGPGAMNPLSYPEMLGLMAANLGLPTASFAGPSIFVEDTDWRGRPKRYWIDYNGRQSSQLQADEATVKNNTKSFAPATPEEIIDSEIETEEEVIETPLAQMGGFTGGMNPLYRFISGGEEDVLYDETDLPEAQRGMATAADSLALYNNALQQKAYYDKLRPHYEPPHVGKWLYTPDKVKSIEHEHKTYNIPEYLSSAQKKELEKKKKIVKSNTDPNVSYILDLVPGALDPNAPLLRYDQRIEPQGSVSYTPKLRAPAISESLNDPDFFKYLKMSKEEIKLFQTLLKDKSGKGKEVIMAVDQWGDPFFKNMYKKRGIDKQYIVDYLKKKGISEKTTMGWLYKKIKDYETSEATPGMMTTLPYYDPLAVKPADMLTDEEVKKRYKKYGPSGIPASRIKKLGLTEKDISKPVGKAGSKKSKVGKSTVMTKNPDGSVTTVEEDIYDSIPTLQTLPAQPVTIPGMVSDEAMNVIPTNYDTSVRPAKVAYRSQTIMEPDPNNPGKYRMRDLERVPYSTTKLYREGDVWEEEHAPRVIWVDEQGNEYEYDPRTQAPTEGDANAMTARELELEGAGRKETLQEKYAREREEYRQKNLQGRQQKGGLVEAQQGLNISKQTIDYIMKLYGVDEAKAKEILNQDQVRKAKVNYVPQRYTTSGGLFRTLAPWNPAFGYAGSWGKQMTMPYYLGTNQAYTGSLAGMSPEARYVTKTGFLNRKPKEWIDIYSVDGNMPTSTEEAMAMFNPKGNQRPQRERRVKDESGDPTRFERSLDMMANPFRRIGAPIRNAFNALKKDIPEAQFGLSGFDQSTGFGMGIGTTQGNCTDFDKKNPSSPCYDPSYSGSAPSTTSQQANPFDYITPTGTGSYQETVTGNTNAPIPQKQESKPDTSKVGVKYKRKDMRSVDPEAFVNVANAAGRGLAKGISNFANRNANRDTIEGLTQPEAIYGEQEGQFRGDWVDLGSMLGQYRFDQMGQDRSGFSSYGQKGGYMQSGGFMEGDEVYMSDEELEEFIRNGGEVEYL